MGSLRHKNHVKWSDAYLHAEGLPSYCISTKIKLYNNKVVINIP